MKSEELDIFSKVKHFVLDEYNGSQNAEEWINIFEKECDRLRVDLDVSKIQILRLFLEENAVEWYKATLSKFSINGTWNQWSQLFLDTYAGKNWSQVFHAFNYRYIRGSLLDYALKKERLLLETDAKITETTRINLIACGLPSYVYNKFNIKEVSSTVKLMNILGTYNNISKKKESNLRMKLSSFQEKKPCTVCEKLGFSGRFHPMEMCWNKDKKKVHFTVKKGAPQVKVKTIKRFGENKVYMFSNQHQNAEEHKSLLNIPSVRRAVEVISNRGDYRDVVATLPEDIVGLYFDEEENFVFQDYLLAECNKTATTN
ncbi:hypothetical protein WA026_014125 [Henosepilachna vigintioctopunctata]|uniref:Retrotransposon gag domain-containing protein n=1 Tax=Henosepilachna vigintioctopunctata TaxID=420089 RepID=A0AAW1TKB9_9CUCU